MQQGVLRYDMQYRQKKRQRTPFDFHPSLYVRNNRIRTARIANTYSHCI